MADEVPFDNHFRDVPSDKLFNLDGLTVRGFEWLVRASAFEPERVWYIGHRDRRLSDHPPARRSLRSLAFRAFELPAQVPLLQEICCARVCAVLRLPPSSPTTCGGTADARHAGRGASPSSAKERPA